MTTVSSAQPAMPHALTANYFMMHIIPKGIFCSASEKQYSGHANFLYCYVFFSLFFSFIIPKGIFCSASEKQYSDAKAATTINITFIFFGVNVLLLWGLNQDTSLAVSCCHFNYRSPRHCQPLNNFIE
jgi:hypothetical protein